MSNGDEPDQCTEESLVVLCALIRYYTFCLIAWICKNVVFVEGDQLALCSGTPYYPWTGHAIDGG